MHCRVLPSPCTRPMPNLAKAPSKAISSVTIWPVLRKATESGPCSPRIALKRATNVRIAVSQSVGSGLPRLFFTSGVTARSLDSSTLRLPHPLGQAMPRLTGYSVAGVRPIASPRRKWMFSPHPVEQKPQTIVVVASGTSRAGTLPRPKPPGASSISRVRSPSRFSRKSSSTPLISSALLASWAGRRR